MAENNIQQETLSKAIQGYVRSGLIDTRTSFPGIVTGFDETKQTASIQPLIKATLGSGDVVAMPVLIDVPILFPRAGGFSITFPVKVGDEAWISCADRDFSAWLQLGGLQKPDSRKIHSLDSAVAHLGLYNQTNVIPDFDTTGLVLRSDDNATHIRIQDGNVDIVSSGTMNVTVPTTTWTGDVDFIGDHTHLGNMDHTGDTIDIGTFNSFGAMFSNLVEAAEHVHSGVTPGPSSSGKPVV